MKKGQKRCKSCKEPFTPRYNKLEQVCSVKCSIAWAQTEDGRAYYLKDRRRDTKERKQAAKTKGVWLKEAQYEFNRWIRLRDRGRACICCGKVRADRKYNACHYRSVGAYPELRFDPNNVHLGCETCNQYLSGNIAEYRIGLIDKIGLEAVESLEGPHEPQKYTIDDIKAIKAQYKKMARELELR